MRRTVTVRLEGEAGVEVELTITLPEGSVGVPARCVELAVAEAGGAAMNALPVFT